MSSAAVDESTDAKKYELVAEDTVEVFGVKLFRIRSKRTFGEVAKGDLGGYVASEDNLSQVSDEAWVFGEARVFGKAQVFGEARVFDDLDAIRQDYWSILDLAPAEVAGLRKTMVDGRINGSTYEGACACLAGTIANEHGCAVDSLGEEMGITTDSSRLAEQWFMPIREGDAPLPLDTKEWPSDGVYRISQALVWLDEWVESRKAIAEALGAAA